jgi:hypothetical protein
MHGITVSLVTYGIAIVIGFFIATLIWALPKLINLLPHGEDKKD